MSERDWRASDDRRADAVALDSLPKRAYWLIALVALGMLGAWVVMEVQASVTGFVNAEGLWSKMQKQSVLALYRYAENGDPRLMAEARAALKTPLEDLAFRDAMERPSPDLAAARTHLRAAGNREEDVERILWAYRFFADAPYLRDSIRAWKRTDADLQALVDMAEEMEARVRAGPLDPAAAADYRRRLVEINARMYPLTVAFSDSLARGANAIRNLLLVLSSIVFVLLTWYALWVMRRTLRHVRETESEFRLAFHQSAVGMLKINPDGSFAQANEAMAKLLGMPLPDLRGMRVQDIVLAEDLAQGPDGALDWQGLLGSGERRLLARDGAMRWVRWTASRMGGAGSAGERAFVLVEDVSDAHALAQEIAHQASHDELTGLINRREVMRRLTRIVQARGSLVPHVLAFVDLDQFKLVNDTCGHAAGDRFLRCFADLMSRELREGDWIGRLGGDEFAVLLHGLNLDEGEREMARLQQRLARTSFRWNGRELSLNSSAGLVEVGTGPNDVEWLLHAADEACYLAKEEGRNRVRRYNESDQLLVRRRHELEWVADAQAAMVDQRLVLYAQKIVPLHGVSGLRYEVLVRMRDAQGRLHLPAHFLTALERYGQAVAVDSHVVDALLAHYRDAGAHLEQLELCHLNVSAQSIADPTFLEFVSQRLDAHPHIAPKLCFEITETAVIGNLLDARRFIDAVRARGCQVALDDFGSGLSSFAYLKSLPVDVLKIDSVFVRDVAAGSADLAMVRSMSQIARALGKATVAEGVESVDVPARLAQVGVDFIQGYAVHEPCPLEELISAPEAAWTGNRRLAGGGDDR